jgi:hypothetical protein
MQQQFKLPSLDKEHTWLYHGRQLMFKTTEVNHPRLNTSPVTIMSAISVYVSVYHDQGEGGGHEEGERDLVLPGLCLGQDGHPYPALWMLRDLHTVAYLHAFNLPPSSGMRKA